MELTLAFIGGLFSGVILGVIAILCLCSWVMDGFTGRRK
jgi:hypothetical protein